MLCKKYEDCIEKVPGWGDLYVQPKLDGIRAVWTGKSLMTRPSAGTPSHEILGIPHVVEELEEYSYSHPLDGEAYSFDISFEEISGIVRRTVNLHPHRRMVGYHIYDGYNRVEKFGTWQADFTNDFALCIPPPKYLIRVESTLIESGTPHLHAVITRLRDTFIGAGYEGAIIRRADSHYVGGRTWDLLKYKQWHDEEAIVIGFIEGKGKFNGMLGAIKYRLVADHKITGKVGGGMRLPNGHSTLSDFERQHIWDYHSRFRHRTFTLCYQEKTAKSIPRFPKFKGWVD